MSMTASNTPAYEMTANVARIKCLCCGESDIVTPCRDCEDYCTAESWCKAQGMTKVRLRAGRVLRILVRWVEP